MSTITPPTTATFEIAVPDVEEATQTHRAGVVYGKCFPMQCFEGCPGIVKAIIPSTWRKIHDKTHLILVLGVISSLLLVGNTIYGFVSPLARKCPSGTYCIKEICAMVFILPNILYFVSIIGQYDDKLQAKQLDAKHQKEKLQHAYNNLLADMDGLLTKSAESSSGLAERSFESKRRDFQRFLERAKSRYNSIYTGSKGEGQKLTDEFRRFVANWLKVFEECSIDPINRPKSVVTVEELEQCTSVAEICELTLDRLRVTEVRFISIQRDEDAQMLRKTRNDNRRLTIENDQDAGDARQLVLMESGHTLTTELSPGAGNSSRRCTWMSLGPSGVGCNRSQSKDGYPKEIRLGCFRIAVLSREHAGLLSGFVVGWILVALSLVSLSDEEEHLSLEAFFTPSLYELLLIQLCSLVLLMRFEELDIVYQLEREVAELKRVEAGVQEKRAKMQKFWSQAQQLTELWLYRTVPRLDLYKEVQSHLEDASPEVLNTWMETANRQLESIDTKLGALENWRNEGTVSLESKKTFGSLINQLCHESEFDEISRKLDDMSRNGIACLVAPGQSSGGPTEKIAMPRPSLRNSGRNSIGPSEKVAVPAANGST